LSILYLKESALWAEPHLHECNECWWGVFSA
jgi:hypothetical protein